MTKNNFYKVLFGSFLVLDQYLVQVFLLRQALSLDLGSDQLQVVLLPRRQALEGDLRLHRRGELVLRRSGGQRLGRLRHRRHFLLVGSGLRGGPRQRLELDLDVGLLRRRLLDLDLRGRFGRLCDLVLDDEERGVR